MPDDPHWPRAARWLAGSSNPRTVGSLAVIGAPLRLGSITPGRCDLAPRAIRDALFRFSTYDFDEDADVRELDAVDLGDLPVAESSPEAAFSPVMANVRAAVEKHSAVVVLGGDNSVTRPGVHALGAPLHRCGLLTLDAHLDLRTLDNGLSNGNPIRALLADGLPGHHIVQAGIQSFANSPEYARVARDAGIHLITADAFRRQSVDAVINDSLEMLSQRADAIYIDLDLDVMDRIFVPATPGSRPGGLLPEQVRRAAYLCGLHPKVRVLDLVEMDPTQDIAQCTSLAAAACLLSFASGLVLQVKAAGA